MNEDIRAGLSVEDIKRDLIDNLFYLQGKFPEVATRNDWYLAAEFLVGPQLGINLLRLHCTEEFRQALQELNLNLDDIIQHEEEPGLGTGGLGRLAACFIESMSTLQVPAIGYGIRYEFG